MKREELLKKIKSEYETAEQWNRGDRGRYYKLRFDCSDGEFWADCYLNEGDFDRYKSESIIEIPYNDIVSACSYPVTVDEIICEIYKYCAKKVQGGVIEE